jgi:hypothetical protein
MTNPARNRATLGRRRLVPFALAFSALALVSCGSATKTTKVGTEAPKAASTAAPAAATSAKPGVTATTADPAAGATTAATTAAPAATVAPVAVPPTLDFTAPLVGGGTFDAKQYAGKKVAFWFWAPT